MSGVLLALIAVLILWMLACAWCGYYVKLLRFVGVWLGGLALNLTWMMTALKATPFEDDALIAQAAATLYALSAFGIGWMVGRIARQLQATRVEPLER